MLNGIAKFLNSKEIRYESVKFRYYSPLWNSKPVRYIRKFVISENSLYLCSYLTSFIVSYNWHFEGNLKIGNFHCFDKK